MRILLFHNWYQQPGGEDTVVRTEMALLETHGHDVSLLDADNRTIRSVGAKVRTATSVAHSGAAGATVAEELARVQPDIVHVHNFFPLLTPAVLDACRRAGVPVVLTLHNYRLLCPGATLLRDGKPCELCLSGSTLNAVRYRCYRESPGGIGGRRLDGGPAPLAADLPPQGRPVHRSQRVPEERVRARRLPARPHQRQAQRDGRP